MGVVTQPDRPAGRGHKLTATPAKRAAEARGLRVLTPLKLTGFVDEARELAPDAFVVASYGKIVPQALLDVVPIAFNVHPSLLPLYRGATPLQSAIRDGRTETGVTIIAMDAGMDTGDVLLQERTPLGADETYGQLHDRLALRGAAMALDAVDRYANGTLTRTPQSDLARELGISGSEIVATVTRPLRKPDLVIDWEQPGGRIVDLVRALAPQPLARTEFLEESLKIVAAHFVTMQQLQEIAGIVMETVPRTLSVTAFPPYVYVVTRDGAVVVDRLIAANRGSMSAEAFSQRAFAGSRE